jgi:CBS domain-containing protein
MRVRDLMTEAVLTVGPEAPIKDVARILVDNRISGLPVCDIEGHVLGVVSEGDILYKEHDPLEGRLGGPLGWLADGPPKSGLEKKAKALTVRAAMTSPAVTIAPWEPAAEAARLMSERGVNRLPVVKDGLLVGIVTRADLVRAYVRGDEAIERELRHDLIDRTMMLEPGRVDVAVHRGVVELTGRLHTRSDVELLERLAARTPGVTSVKSALLWEVDDSTRKSRREAEKQLR